MTNELITYVRETRGSRKGEPRGVVVAVKHGENNFRIGWSFTRTSPVIKDGKVVAPPDKFNRERGLAIARARANVSTKVTIPSLVSPILGYMRKRAAKYFRTPIELIAV